MYLANYEFFNKSHLIVGQNIGTLAWACGF
jgi:hypothetical protein